jgi:predicted O-linked N-acetylglucosamine transferase (SPINDLY family)
MLIGSMLFNKARYHDSAADFARAVDQTVTSRFDTWSHSRAEESLRIGFVSGDLRSHPVGYFIEGLLAQLQSSSIELFAYPTVNTEDNLTGRLRACFHEWSPLVGLNDKDAALKIHSDGIHILIDLSGHTAENRLPVFAWKPAPIQVGWLGYFASTGLSEMDYILGDPCVTPHEEADHFSEKIWQLPETYLCFTPPDLDLKVAPLPAWTNGFVTFGCFNNLARMTDEIVSVRATILHAVPDSKLFLKDKQLDHESGRHRVLSRFAAVDIEADRLILEGKSPREDYLACYDRVDIALSPFPYGGGTTSVEGLWMGVPVITKKGNHFLSHLGESIAHNSGLSDWIASDEEEYVAKAVAYASNLESLSELRNGMRELILATPLFDVPRFALRFEHAVRAMRKEIR